jgi:lipopolysaccharide export system permease protein
MLGFKLLYKELFKELASLFLLCLGIFLGLIVLGRLLKLSELLVNLDLNILDVGRLIFYLSPFFLLLLIPVACMFSMFLTFQRMSADRELIALRAGGVSLSQILPAPIVFLLLCALLNGFLSFQGVAWGMDRFQSTLLQLAKTKAQLSLQPGTFNEDFPGLTIYAQNVDRSSGRLESVFVHDATRAESSLAIVAPVGHIRTDQQQGTISFVLRRGRIYHSRAKGSDILTFGEYSIGLDLRRLLGDVDIDRDDPKALSWSEIQRLLASRDLEEKKGREYVLELALEEQKRLALPASCFVLGFFAIPLGWLFEGVRRNVGALVVLSMFLTYYGLFSMGVSLGDSGRLSPLIGLWAPNAIFLLLSGWLFWLAKNERGKWFGQ